MSLSLGVWPGSGASLPGKSSALAAGCLISASRSPWGTNIDGENVECRGRAVFDGAETPEGHADAETPQQKVLHGIPGNDEAP